MPIDLENSFRRLPEPASILLLMMFGPALKKNVEPRSRVASLRYFNRTVRDILGEQLDGVARALFGSPK